MNNTCICCGAVIPEGLQVCRACESGHPDINNHHFIAIKYARGNHRFLEEALAMSDREIADACAEYVEHASTIGEPTLVGVAIWETLSQGYRPFANQWTSKQFEEWLGGAMPSQRWGAYLNSRSGGRKKKERSENDDT